MAIAYNAKSVTVFLVWHAAVIEPACLRFSKTRHNFRRVGSCRQDWTCSVLDMARLSHVDVDVDGRCGVLRRDRDILILLPERPLY